MEAVTRRRLFLGASAAVAVLVVLIAHEVMLPFVLASVIAYVLTPLVAAARAAQVPACSGDPARVRARPGDPRRLRAGHRAAHRARVSHPERRAARSWRPRRAITGSGHRRSPAGGRDRAPAPTAEAPPPASTSAFVARPQPDGSLAIDVGAGVVVTETKRGWLVEPAPENRKASRSTPTRPSRRRWARASPTRSRTRSRLRGRSGASSARISARHLRLLHHADARGVPDADARAHRGVLPLPRAP